MDRQTQRIERHGVRRAADVHRRAGQCEVGAHLVQRSGAGRQVDVEPGLIRPGINSASAIDGGIEPAECPECRHRPRESGGAKPREIEGEGFVVGTCGQRRRAIDFGLRTGELDGRACSRGQPAFRRPGQIDFDAVGAPGLTGGNGSVLNAQLGNGAQVGRAREEGAQ